MKITSFCLCAPLFATPTTADETTDRQIAESRAAVVRFSASLKARLMAAMQAGGPVNAISVCHDVAALIAAEQSARSGMKVGRTSLKTRNPANAPDSWETAVLQQFEARKSAGQDVAALEYHEIVEKAGRSRFRYTKAIPTAPHCLACHGDNPAPEVVEKLTTPYPQDRATGFKPGDIRGAFTISRSLD